MSEAAHSAGHGAGANFSTAYKRYGLAVMTAIHGLLFVDRGVMKLLLQPIKEDLRLSDTQLGLVTGIAFGFFYATLGLPISRWADRGNRVTIASIAIGLWGATVMMAVFVTNYVQLLLARMMAAVGESGCAPPTYSLLGDYFTGTAERTRAMSIYLTASGLATLISFAAAGWLNELYGWRITFFLMGIPGLIMAVVVKLTLVEPRELVTNAREKRPPAPSFVSVIATLWSMRSYRSLTIALVLLYTMSLGLAPWYAAFMIRSHGMGTAELGIWFGLIFSICSTAGFLLGGYLAARWFAEDEAGQMRMSAVAITLLVPCYVAFFTLPNKYHALVALVPLLVAVSTCFAPIYALLQRLVADDMRATALAVVMLLANLIGMGIGPQIVGILSDAFRPRFGTDSLRYAMLIMSFVALWAAYYFWKVGGTIATDLASGQLQLSSDRQLRARAAAAR